MSQVLITFPDGNKKEFTIGISGLEIAESISKSLAKNAIACKVDGELLDIYRPINKDCTFEIVTPTSADGLEILRHSCAHLLADAVKSLYPDTQVTIGPVIENGFYYDFAREEPFYESDLAIIEKRMQEIATTKKDIRREELSAERAIEYFESIGEYYKVEIIKDIAKKDPSAKLSVYRQGDFMDLCRGVHLSNVSFLKHFKLQKVSGSYWRGKNAKWEFGANNNKFFWLGNDGNGNGNFNTLRDCYLDAIENGYFGIEPKIKDDKVFTFNPSLQRVYGTCFASKEDLDGYLKMLEEAEKRDHRKLGKELDLFHQQEEAPGDIFWHPNGWTLYLTIQNYIRKLISENGYHEIKTPQMMKKVLWEMSGHWEKYRENMFTSIAEDEEYAIKPMNCPGHVQVFKNKLRSYKDLPLRFAEFGCCHRYEPSGSLHGIMRVRSMVQDDAHIFCTEGQIVSETADFCKLVMKVYADFGFTDIKIMLSTRPEKRAGTDETWDKAENGLANAVKACGYDFEISEGDGAFYGPKLEFQLRDTIGRSWQCGTLQLDFVLPERLDAHYISEDGSRQRPVMLHRAILGSLERFIGVLIEHYAGKFPSWLAPIQVVVCGITNKQDDYVTKVSDKLKASGIRVISDLEPEKIGYKIRKYSLQKVPFIAICGEKEAESGTISIRQMDSTEEKVVRIEEFIKML